MLQQILQDMYIDPELLEELDEDQKQILFCKIREEQVRRWQETEDKLVKKEKKKTPKPEKSGKKKVEFLLATDGSPWVWVMGDHTDDKTIEEILEENVHEKARKEAESEAEALQKLEEDRNEQLLKEEQEKLEKERLEREKLLRQQSEEAARQHEQSIKEEKELEEKLAEEKKQTEILRQNKIREFQRDAERRRRSSMTNILELKEQRENEIYSTMQKVREKIAELADEGHPLIEAAWQEQEKKAKQAEGEKRAMARKAREDHRKSLSMKTGSQVISTFIASYNNIHNGQQPEKPAIAKKPVAKARTSKPANHYAIIKWFRDQEEPCGAGLDPQTKQLATWFHGIISRQESEDLLEDKKEGSFLVRVSEKVYGYAVSFKSAVRCKHFLIDVSQSGYKFFGFNQMTHESLAKLVEYHKNTEISSVGKEKLVYACGQICDPPDTAELFADNKVQVSYL